MKFLSRFLSVVSRVLYFDVSLLFVLRFFCFLTHSHSSRQWRMHLFLFHFAIEEDLFFRVTKTRASRLAFRISEGKFIVSPSVGQLFSERKPNSDYRDRKTLNASLSRNLPNKYYGIKCSGRPTRGGTQSVC